MLNEYIIIIWSPLTVFLCFHMFSFFLIKLILWLKLSIDKRQVEDMGGQRQGPQHPAPFQPFESDIFHLVWCFWRWFILNIHSCLGSFCLLLLIFYWLDILQLKKKHFCLVDGYLDCFWSGLLWIMLLWLFIYRSLCGTAVLSRGNQPTPWISPWCWERLRPEGEEGIRGWDGWMASLI